MDKDNTTKETRISLDLDNGSLTAKRQTEKHNSMTAEEKKQLATRITTIICSTAAAITALIIAGPIALLPISLIGVLAIVIFADIMEG